MALVQLCGGSFGVLLHEVVSGQRPIGKRATEDLRRGALYPSCSCCIYIKLYGILSQGPGSAACKSVIRSQQRSLKCALLIWSCLTELTTVAP